MPYHGDSMLWHNKANVISIHVYGYKKYGAGVWCQVCVNTIM